MKDGSLKKTNIEREREKSKEDRERTVNEEKERQINKKKELKKKVGKLSNLYIDEIDNTQEL